MVAVPFLSFYTLPDKSFHIAHMLHLVSRSSEQGKIGKKGGFPDIDQKTVAQSKLELLFDSRQKMKTSVV